MSSSSDICLSILNNILCAFICRSDNVSSIHPFSRSFPQKLVNNKSLLNTEIISVFLHYQYFSFRLELLHNFKVESSKVSGLTKGRTRGFKFQAAILLCSKKSTLKTRSSASIKSSYSPRSLNFFKIIRHSNYSVSTCLCL